MLKIEKTLKELRDLQNTLHDLGIEMSINDADNETKNDYEDAAMTIDIYEPCRCFAWVGMDGGRHLCSKHAKPDGDGPVQFGTKQGMDGEY